MTKWKKQEKEEEEQKEEHSSLIIWEHKKILGDKCGSWRSKKDGNDGLLIKHKEDS